MSAKDVEILEEMWEELGQSAPTEVSRDAAERWWHPEIEYVEDPRWPGSSAYRGRDQVIAAWNGYLEVFGSTEMKLEQLIDVDDQVVALVRVRGVSKAGNVPVEHVWASVCRVRDGQLAYQRAYWDIREAMEDAGIS